MYDRILLPVDGSDEAKRAAKRGIELARTFDAAVDIVHVVERRSRRLARTDAETAQLRERGDRILAEIEALASAVDRPVTTTLTEGTPAVRIAEHAADRDASLIVIGKQGLTGLGKRLLGGVTEGSSSGATYPSWSFRQGIALPRTRSTTLGFSCRPTEARAPPRPLPTEPRWPDGTARPSMC